MPGPFPPGPFPITVEISDLEEIKAALQALAAERDEWRSKALALHEAIREHERSRACHSAEPLHPFGMDGTLYETARRVAGE